MVLVALYALIGAASLGWLLCLRANAPHPDDRPPLSMLLFFPPCWLIFAIVGLLMILSLWVMSGWRGRAWW